MLPKSHTPHTLVVVSLDPPIRRGQTFYNHLLCQFNNDEEQSITLNITDAQLAAKNAAVRGGVHSTHTQDEECCRAISLTACALEMAPGCFVHCTHALPADVHLLLDMALTRCYAWSDQLLFADSPAHACAAPQNCHGCSCTARWRWSASWTAQRMTSLPGCCGACRAPGWPSRASSALQMAQATPCAARTRCALGLGLQWPSL